jgi:hypothetical protein
MWPWTIFRAQRQQLADLQERQAFVIRCLQEATRRAAELRTEVMVLRSRVEGYESAEAEMDGI